MRKILLLFILNVVVFNSGFALDIKKQEYNASHFKIIESFYLIADGELSLNLADYYYSLNEGAYKRFNSVVHDQLDTKLKILDLELKPGKNSLKVLYKNDESALIFIYFLQPILNVVSVEQNGKQLIMLNGSYILESQNAVNISYEYDFPENTYGPLWGPAVVASVNYYFGEWARTTNEIVTIENFNYGINEFLIQPINNKNETYLTERLTFFYADFQLPESIWKKDTLVKLTGYPEGGYFTGDGVMGNSNSFNPNLTVGQNQSVVYHYPFGDSEIIIERFIQVFSYSFSLFGELSVCRNETDVIYQVENFNNNFSYKWQISGGTFLNLNESLSSNKVRWNTNAPGNFGKIYVKAIHKETGTEFDADLSVYLKNSVAYDKSGFFFGDADKRLLICQKTDAYKYLWSKDGSSKVETTTPYHYFDGPGNTYELTLVTEEGCETVIDLAAEDLNKSDKIVPIAGIQNPSQVKIDINLKQVTIYPNPVQNNLIVQTSISEEIQRVRIFDNTTHCVLDETIESGKSNKKLDISHLKSGTYILQVLEGNKVVSKQFIKMQ